MGKGGLSHSLVSPSVLANRQIMMRYFGNNAPFLAHMGFIVKCVGIHYDMNASGFLGNGMAQVWIHRWCSREISSLWV
jgi:hypothetical protein